MASATITFLSRNDSAVLNALFDPEASLHSPVMVDTGLAEAHDPGLLTKIKEQERQALLLINEDRPNPQTIHDAVQRLSQIIANHRDYASAWNNRAQATRMLLDTEESSSYRAGIKDVYNDLTQAIKLASSKDSVGHQVSTDSARVLASAHTHRGYILWRASRPEASNGMLDAIESLEGSSKDRLEELASNDFALGGRYGNQQAQQFAVKTNPYAKLCGSIVKEAMRKEMMLSNKG